MCDHWLKPVLVCNLLKFFQKYLLCLDVGASKFSQGSNKWPNQYRLDSARNVMPRFSSKASQLSMSLFWKVSCQPQYSFGLRSMRMVTMLAGQQLQKDTAKRKLATMSPIREDSEADTGENRKSFLCDFTCSQDFCFVHWAERSISLMPPVEFLN